MAHGILVTDEKYQGLNPIHFGHQKCEPFYSYGPLARTWYVIHFVVSGCGTFRTEGREYTVNSGEMFVIRPFDETYYQADGKNPWNYIWIGFQASSSLPLELPDVISCPDALSIFQKMKNCESMEQGKSAYLAARLWDLFSLLLGKEPHTPDYVESALACIHGEYMNSITIEEIANRLNLDRSYLYTIFKRSTGLSPKEYLQQYRLNIAASLMTDKGINVSVAANSVGYENIFLFSKMFKRHFGMSPTEYIKSNTSTKK